MHPNNPIPFTRSVESWIFPGLLTRPIFWHAEGVWLRPVTASALGQVLEADIVHHGQSKVVEQRLEVGQNFLEN